MASHTAKYMAVFRDIVSGTATGEARIIGELTYSDVLNAAGTATCQIPLDCDENTVLPGRSSLTILRDKFPIWSGIVWQVSPSVQNHTLDINASGWLSYLEHRVLSSTKDYYIKDQTSEITKDLIDTMQAVPGGNVGWTTTNITASGVTRTLETIYFYEKRIYGDLIRDLSQSEDGFDYGIVLRQVADQDEPGYDFFTWYPRRGRRLLGTVWAYTGEGKAGSTMVPSSVTYDASSMAWRVHGTGRSEGYLTPVVVKSNSDYALTFPLYEKVVSYSDVGLLDELDNLVSADLEMYEDLLGRLTLDLRPGTPESKPGSFAVGDQVIVSIDCGWFQVNTWYRIESWTVSWDGMLELVSVEVQEDTN